MASFMMIQLIIWQLLMACVDTMVSRRRRDATVPRRDDGGREDTFKNAARAPCRR